MMDLRKIQAFIFAAETLSFSEAAKHMHITQPAVSNQIKSLETEVKVKLFTRTNTGLVLTEAGKLLLPWAYRVQKDISNLEAMMTSFKSDIAGELRVACSTTAGKYVLPQMAARFCQHVPNVRVRILACTAEDIMLRLLEGDAHLGVISREILEDGLETQEFFRDTITLIIPRNHRWVGRKMIDPNELLDEPIIMREETSGTRRVLLSELSKFDININDLMIFMELGNAEAIVRTVAAGHGIAFVSRLASEYAMEEGKVAELVVDGLNLKRTIYMVRKKTAENHRPSEAFWGFIHAPENKDLIMLPQ